MGLGLPGAGGVLRGDLAGATANSLVGRTGFSGLWLQGPESARAGSVLLVGGAVSWTSWLRVPQCPRAGFSLLLGRLGPKGCCGRCRPPGRWAGS